MLNNDVKDKSKVKDNYIFRKSKSNKNINESFKKSLKKLLELKSDFDLPTPTSYLILNQNKLPISQIKTISNNHLIDLHNIIKRLILTINNQESYAEFELNDGVFANTHFAIHNKEKKLKIFIKNASSKGKSLLLDHQILLKTKLKPYNLKLSEIKFYDEEESYAKF